MKPLPWENANALDQAAKEELYTKCPLVSRRVKNILQDVVPKKKKDKARVTVAKNRKIGDYFAPKGFFKFCDKDDEIVSKTNAFFGVQQPTDLYFNPNGSYNNIYSVNKAAKDIVTHATRELNLFMAGVKVYVKESRSSSMVKLKPREAIADHVKNRVVEVSVQDMIKLLNMDQNESLDFAETCGDRSSENIREMLAESGVGSVKFKCCFDNDDGDFYEALGFIGQKRVQVDINPQQRYHGLLVLGDRKLE